MQSCQRCNSQDLQDGWSENNEFTFCGNCGQIQNLFCTAESQHKGRAGGSGKTQSTQEAMDLLSATRHTFISRGRYEAFKLCEQGGFTFSQEVIAEMERQGLLSDKTIKRVWAGRLFFGCPLFEWTGEYYTPPVPENVGNAHSWRPGKIWRLAPGAKRPEKVLFDCEKEQSLPPRRKVLRRNYR